MLLFKWRNRKKSKEVKNWIESIEPDYFIKKSKRAKLPKENKQKNKKVEKKKKEEEIVENEELNKKEEAEIKKHEEEEIKNYNQKKIIPNYEEFEFAINGNGSGFIVGNGEYVITNHHVIEKATRVAVRNGIGKVTNARVLKTSEKYDLAILQLETPYPNEYSIKAADFEIPKFGDDVISIGYPGIGVTYDKPTITQGIISKVFVGDGDGIFLTSATVNPGNSGGPVINLNGDLLGVIYAGTNVFEVAKATGVIETGMGFGVSSSKIEEIFNYKNKNKN